MSLGVTYEFTVPNIAAALVDYDQARLWKAPSQGGTYTYLTSLALVAGTAGYAYRDPAGLPTDFYTHELFNSLTLDVSLRPEPVPGSVEPIYTRQEIRRRSAAAVGVYGRPPTEYTSPGPSGTTTAAGAATTVVCSSYAAGDYLDRDFRGWSLLVNDGAQAGKERRVTGIDAATGTFTVTPALPGAPGTGASFDLYGEAPSQWWNDRINEARLHVWYPFRWPLAGVSGRTEYVLPEWIASDHQITRMTRQHGAVAGGEYRALGYTPEVIERDGGGLSLYAPALGANSIWWLEGRRNPPELLADSATVMLDDQRLELFVVSVAVAAASKLAEQLGAAEDRDVWDRRAKELELKRRGLVRAIGGFTQQRMARKDALVTIGTDWP